MNKKAVEEYIAAFAWLATNSVMLSAHLLESKPAVKAMLECFIHAKRNPRDVLATNGFVVSVMLCRSVCSSDPISPAEEARVRPIIQGMFPEFYAFRIDAEPIMSLLPVLEPVESYYNQAAPGCSWAADWAKTLLETKVSSSSTQDEIESLHERCNWILSHLHRGSRRHSYRDLSRQLREYRKKVAKFLPPFKKP